jgi:hypothetical protein
MKKSLLILISLGLSTLGSFSQFAVGYNNDGNSICISSNPLKNLIFEMRVNTTPFNQATFTYKDRGITQAYFLINVFSSDNSNLYAGGGIGADLLSNYRNHWVSVNIPIGLKINPFSKMPQLFLTGEYNPMIITSDDNPIIHSISIGFRFLLEKK